MAHIVHGAHFRLSLFPKLQFVGLDLHVTATCITHKISLMNVQTMWLHLNPFCFLFFFTKVRPKYPGYRHRHVGKTGLILVSGSVQ